MPVTWFISAYPGRAKQHAGLPGQEWPTYANDGQSLVSSLPTTEAGRLLRAARISSGRRCRYQRSSSGDDRSRERCNPSRRNADSESREKQLVARHSLYLWSIHRSPRSHGRLAPRTPVGLQKWRCYRDCAHQSRRKSEQHARNVPRLKRNEKLNRRGFKSAAPDASADGDRARPRAARD
jgi:hypothetical protein